MSKNKKSSAVTATVVFTPDTTPAKKENNNVTKTKTAKPAAFALRVGVVEFVAESGRTYRLTTVKKGKGLVTSCSCPGFRRWSKCKHATAAVEGTPFVKSAKMIDTTTEENTMSKKSKKTAAPATKSASKVTKVTKTKKVAQPVASSKRPVVKVTKTEPVATKKVRAPKFAFPVGVPVNVKVAGEKTMRKDVTLVAHPERRDVVLVKTGKRGRPSMLAVENIERARAL